MAEAASLKYMRKALNAANYEQAINIGKQLLEQDKNNLAAAELLASAYQSNRDYNLAEQTVRRGLKVNDNHQGTYKPVAC
jgi:Tfp pilus assembly protein PilF